MTHSIDGLRRIAESSRQREITHGHTAYGKVSKPYQTWRGMLNRCYRAKTKGFEHWGGRGIRVCDRWRFGEDGKSGFECFLADAGEPPTLQHTIDRINTNGNYEPGNVRWTTWREQQRNKTNHRMLTAFGKTQMLEDWGREYKMDAAFIHNRIFRDGMSVEDALTRPIRKPQLSVEAVQAIRDGNAKGIPRVTLASQYGTSRDMVHRIIHGKAYAGRKQ